MEDLGNENRVKPGDKVTINGQEHTVRAIEVNGPVKATTPYDLEQAEGGVELTREVIIRARDMLFDNQKFDIETRNVLFDQLKNDKLTNEKIKFPAYEKPQYFTTNIQWEKENDMTAWKVATNKDNVSELDLLRSRISEVLKQRDLAVAHLEFVAACVKMGDLKKALDKAQKAVEKFK